MMIVLDNEMVVLTIHKIKVHLRLVYLGLTHLIQMEEYFLAKVHKIMIHIMVVLMLMRLKQALKTKKQLSSN